MEIEEFGRIKFLTSRVLGYDKNRRGEIGSKQ